MLVYTEKLTNRVRYIFNLLLREIIGLDFRFTENIDEFKGYSGPRLNYSSHAIDEALFIQSRNLLFETGISEQNITVFHWREMAVFYSTGKASALPFDPFAASFYLVCRYEEYLPHIRDQYDRFEAKDSLAEKNNFLTQPLINIWATWLKEILYVQYPGLKFKENKFSFISTIDIDNAYAYREKGFMRTVGAYARALSRFNMKELSERTQVILRKKQDPYDTYEYQLGIHQKYKMHVIYFFLMGDYGLNDKNISPNNRKFQELITMLADYAEVGIHPSFGSNTKEGQLIQEIKRLSSILHREITKSRQHFLKLRLPDTYRKLIELDIKEDYTMGYASRVGFRAGICSPFNFYDLDFEAETSLRVFPFAMMEGTLKYYMGIPPEKAMDHIRPLIDEVKNVNGTYISLWHNDTLNDRGLWLGWRKVYEEMVEYAMGK